MAKRKTSSAESVIELLTRRVARANGHAMAPALYGVVAELIRSRLPPRDADIVAGWFLRLANNEDPRKIFTVKTRGGRKSLIDRDYEIAWVVHWICQDGTSTDVACKHLAPHWGIEWTTVQNIYSKHRGEIEKICAG